MVTLAGDHFRGGITRRATCCLESFTLCIHIGEAKVNNLDVVLIIQKQILWFQISVTDFNLVDVLDSRYNLLDKSAGFFFLKPFSFDNVIEQFTACCILHDKE